MPDEEQEEIRAVINKKVKESQNGNETIEERFVYSNIGIRLERFRTTISTSEDGQQHASRSAIKERALVGDLIFNAEIITNETLDMKKKWSITFNKKGFTGTFDEITDYLFMHGRSLVNKDKLKQTLAHVLTEVNMETIEAYPAVGLFPTADGKLIFAGDESNVFPAIDSQRTYFEFYKTKKRNHNPNMLKEVLQASSTFISILPDKTRESALIARGFSTIAPLAYAIKSSSIKVFPYLYLYGTTGSSKSQIADTTTTYIYGDREHLSGEAVETSFRLGQEFGATTYPRVVDEAHDVFTKNLSIFKSAATSTQATKRGKGTDKAMDRYPAFCSFVFTSNVEPISPEEDVQGAVMDRVLVAECSRSPAFNSVRDKYNESLKMIMQNGFGLGLVTTEFIMAKAKDMKVIEDEVYALATKFQVKDVNLQSRRAYCLAEVALGIKWYYEILEVNGIDKPIPFVNEEEMISLIYSHIQKGLIEDEKNPIFNFINFVLMATQQRSEKMAELGVFTLTRSLSEEEKYKLGMDSEDLDIFISVATIKHYNRTFTNGKAEHKYSTLKDICVDLSKIGIVVDEATTHKFGNKGNMAMRGLRIPKSEILKHL